MSIEVTEPDQDFIFNILNFKCFAWTSPQGSWQVQFEYPCITLQVLMSQSTTVQEFSTTQLRVKLSSMDFKYKEKYLDAEENVEMVCKTKLCMKYNELLLNKQGIGNKGLLLIQASFMWN